MGKYSRNVSFPSKAAYIDEPGVRPARNQTKTSISIKGPFVLDKDLIKINLLDPVIAAWRHGFPTWKTS